MTDWRRLLHSVEPRWLLAEGQRIRTKFWRRLRRVDQSTVSLKPEGTAQGRVLFSYIIDPFLIPPGKPVPYSHTHFWESLTMAHCFQEQGYRVDAVAWNNSAFVPQGHYDFFVDVRLQMERLAPSMAADTCKVLHMETAHHGFHNPAQQRRLDRLLERRGIRVRPQKMIEANQAIETADCGTILGNDFTRGTYEHAAKPIRRVPISVPFSYPWDESKDFAAVRRRFLWFGSGGLVHKGLDLVLDAFAAMPDYHLTICGPVRREKDFEAAYFRELYQTPNIHTYGWIDVGSAAFTELARNCLGLVYPSCSEGGGGSVLTCMHAGLVPILTRETSVDLAPDRGVLLPGDSVQQIQDAIRELAERPVVELESTARKAWEYARQHHSKDTFLAGYRAVVGDLISGDWKAWD